MLIHGYYSTAFMKNLQYISPKLYNVNTIEYISIIQSKLAKFRTAAGDLLGTNSFMIDVYRVPIDDFHWIDGSSLAS